MTGDRGHGHLCALPEEELEALLGVGGGGGEVEGGVALPVGAVQLHALPLQHLQQHVHVPVQHRRVEGGVPRPGRR